MSVSEKQDKVKRIGKSVLLFLGTLFLLLVAVDAGYAWKNVSVFVNRHVASDAVPTLEPAAAKPDFLSVPSLQVSAPVIYITEKGESVYNAALAQGVVHYPGSALPGEFGNVYIFGHSSDLPWSTGHYKTVFAPLTQVQLGDKIYLTDHEGKLFTYTVFETKIVSPKDLSVLDQYENKEQLLSLQTSYPLGTALQRFIVLARITED